jgi:hypothetical protein
VPGWVWGWVHPSAVHRLSFVGEKERPHYPWQIPIADYFAASRLSESERRRQDAQFFYLFERLLIEEGCESELVYDAEREVFRFPDGRFALSREHADWAGLKAIGYFEPWRL